MPPSGYPLGVIFANITPTGEARGFLKPRKISGGTKVKKLSLPFNWETSPFPIKPKKTPVKSTIEVSFFFSPGFFEVQQRRNSRFYASP